MQFYNKAPFLFRPSQILTRLRHAISSVAPAEVPVVLPWGLEVVVNPSETIGRSVYNTGVHDLLVCEILHRLAAPGEVAVDVGANIGIMSGLLAASVGKLGKVFAFEPHPEVCVRLRQNIRLWERMHNMASIIVEEVAISSVKGHDRLILGEEFQNNQGTASLAKSTHVGGGGAFDVRTTTLTDILPPSSTVGVMKVDVEGHELDVFMGSEQLLASQRVRDVVFEDAAGALPAISALLWKHRYSLFLLNETLFRPVLKPIRNQSELRFGRPYANYLATSDPERVHSAFRRGGWKCLKFGAS